MSVPFLSFIFSSIYFLSFTVHSMNVSNKLHNWFLFIHLWRMIKAYCNLLWDWISLLYWPYFTLINSDTSIVYNNEFVWLLTSFSFDKYHQHINWSFDFNLLFVAQFWTIEFFECNHIRFTCFVKLEFNRECFLFPFFFTEFDNAYRLYCCNCNQYRSLLMLSKAKGHPTASIQHIKVLVKDPTTTKYQLKQQNCFAESFFNSATWPKKKGKFIFRNEIWKWISMLTYSLACRVNSSRDDYSRSNRQPLIDLFSNLHWPIWRDIYVEKSSGSAKCVWKLTRALVSIVWQLINIQ